MHFHWHTSGGHLNCARHKADLYGPPSTRLDIATPVAQSSGRKSHLYSIFSGAVRIKVTKVNTIAAPSAIHCRYHSGGNSGQRSFCEVALVSPGPLQSPDRHILCDGRIFKDPTFQSA